MNEWATISQHGTIDTLITTIAEGDAELARYLEYLYLEKKWKTARNLSSITAMTDLIAYKRALPKSAIGYVVVSHTDLNGVNRLVNFGTSFFDLDTTSDFDELSQKKNATAVEKAALVPWTANESYVVPKGTVFKSANGVQFISTESVESRSLKEPFSVIKKDEVKYASFIEAGGWNGIKYLKIPVIQGEKRTLQLGEATGSRFECYAIDDMTIENASNVISDRYFTVTVTPKIKIDGKIVDDTSQTWEKIDNIRLAGPYDKVFEAIILSEKNQVLLKFGDGITGKLLPKDAVISVNYISTLGTGGNIQQKYQINTMQLPDGFQMIDARTNELSNFMNCTNIVAIMGGKDIEDEDDIKLNAPSSHLLSYSTTTKPAYKEQIEKNSPVNLLHLNIFQSDVVDTESYGTENSSASYTSSLDSKNILQEITATKNALLISALRSNGEKIDDPENELLIPIRQTLDDYMSPNDSLEFIQPNCVEINQNITVSTTDTILEKDIEDELVPMLTAKYSVFNREFNEAYFKSEIIDIAHSLTYVNSIDCFLEAKVKADLEPTILCTTAQKGSAWLEKTGNPNGDFTVYDKNEMVYESLFAFDFSFDKLFAQNKLGAGFKNFKYAAPYLLKADVIFKNDPTKSKTLFLFDGRYDSKDEIDVETAYVSPIDNSKPYPLLTSTNYGLTEIKWIDNFSEYFSNMQARTAQFNYIQEITSMKFLDKAKSFLNSPFEIRPLYIDEFGKNKIFNTDDVEEKDQVSLSLSNDVQTVSCYRKNWQYWDHCKIEFYENYDDPESDDYARGRIIIPVKDILDSTDITSLKVLFEKVENFNEQTPEIKKMLNEKIEINVYAMPIQDNFECDNEFTIIYSNTNNIKVEKSFIVK